MLAQLYSLRVLEMQVFISLIPLILSALYNSMLMLTGMQRLTLAVQLYIYMHVNHTGRQYHYLFC